MSTNVAGNDPTQGAAAPAPEALGAPTANTAHTAGASINGSTKFNSMAQLRAEQPKLYKLIVVGLTTAIIEQSRKAQERSHQLMKDYQNNS